MTRRGFLVAGIGAALGAVALPFLPGKRNDLTPEMLFSIDPATANPLILKQLCLMFYQHPDPAVRFQCARFMAVTTKDPLVKNALWEMIRQDADASIRIKAMKSLIRHRSPEDIPAIVHHYTQSPSMRPAIDGFVQTIEYLPLQDALGTRLVR